MKRNDSIVAKAWTRDLSSIPALAMRLAERCRTISMPFFSLPRVAASNRSLLERLPRENLRLGGKRLLVAGQGPSTAIPECVKCCEKGRDGSCSKKKASVLLGVTPRLRVCLTASLLSPLLVGIGTAVGAADSAIPYHDVAFVSEGVTLHGTVFVPATPPAFAAAVWVDGAGRKTRNIGLAQLFAKRGIALLTYDKRGVGASGGVYAGSEAGTNNVSRENLALLAEDAATAIRALRQERKLSNVPRGFIGGSQAGWIIPAAALKYREARFMLFWSGAIETTHENLL